MDGETQVVIVMMFCLFLCILVFGSVIAYINYSNQVELCDRHNGYGYLTQMEGKWYSHFECYIVMEDRTRVSIKDFNIADYKKPAKR